MNAGQKRDRGNGDILPLDGNQRTGANQQRRAIGQCKFEPGDGFGARLIARARIKARPVQPGVMHAQIVFGQAQRHHIAAQRYRYGELPRRRRAARKHLPQGARPRAPMEDVRPACLHG